MDHVQGSTFQRSDFSRLEAVITRLRDHFRLPLQNLLDGRTEPADFAITHLSTPDFSIQQSIAIKNYADGDSELKQYVLALLFGLQKGQTDPRKSFVFIEWQRSYASDASMHRILESLVAEANRLLSPET